jgi:hypothetical protein
MSNSNTEADEETGADEHSVSKTETLRGNSQDLALNKSALRLFVLLQRLFEEKWSFPWYTNHDCATDHDSCASTKDVCCVGNEGNGADRPNRHDTIEKTKLRWR